MTENNTLIESGRYEKEEMSNALETLRSGGLVLFPSDVSWCIGCDSQNEESVGKLLKYMSGQCVLTVLVDMASRIQSYVDEFPEIAWDLLEVADRPLTLRLNGIKNMTSQLNGKDKNLCFRETKESFSADLCRRMKIPILCIELKVSGLSSYAFSDIDKKLFEKVDYVVNFKRNLTGFTGSSQKIGLGRGGLVEILK